MARKLKVTYPDRDPIIVSASPKAQVMAERQFGCSLMKLDHVEHVYYLAWAALRSTNQIVPDFDDFLGVIDDVEVVPEEDKEDERPTELAQQPDTLSS